MDLKKDIRALSLEELKTVFTENGDQAFRAKQVYEWLWKKSVRTFDEMTNLSKSTRELLNTHFVINAVVVDDMQISKDRTIKNAFKLYDSNIVEGVLIPSTTRMTACISSQVGCSLTCKFCATGKLERLRNLNADEIYDQVVLIKNQAAEKYSKGDYTYGKVDKYGQRINIEIKLKGKDAASNKTCQIISGWMIQNDGSIKLITPFSGFVS